MRGTSSQAWVAWSCMPAPATTRFGVANSDGLWGGAGIDILNGGANNEVLAGETGNDYAPAGKTPVAYAVGGTRQKLSMIAAVTNQGKTRWMIIDEAFTSDKLIEFLEALIKDAGRKVFLILDNLRVHHSKPVKAWVAEHKDRIELFYLPSYSPELNPEKRLNADLKQAIGSKVPARTKAKLKTAATEHMTRLEQTPDRVVSYFQDPHVRYAA